jgi:short-subunit dehydrogenase
MGQKICAIVRFRPGISTGVARSFGKEGYGLALLACNPAKLVDNAQALQTEGYGVQTFAADAGDETSLVQAFAQIRTELGDSEALVYNAAVFTTGKPTSITLTD